MLVRHFVESTARDRRPSCSSAGAGRGLGPPWRRLALVEESGPRTVGGVLALARLSREKGPQPSSARIIWAAAAQAYVIRTHMHMRHTYTPLWTQVLQPLPETPLCSAIENL